MGADDTEVRLRPDWRGEYLVVLGLMVILTALLFALKIIRVDQRFGDTAMLLQLLENIAYRGTPVGQVVAAAIDMTTNHVPTMSAAQIAVNPLLPSGPLEVNHFQFHFYAILYLVAPLVRLFGPEVVLFALFVTSFTGMVLLAYIALRKTGTPIVATAFFCVAIILHPAWSQGLEWQFYPDRIFLAVGLAFMIATSTLRVNRGLTFGLAVLCALIDERAAVTAGLFLIAHVLLYWPTRRRKDRALDFAFGVALVLYGTVLVKFFLPANFYNSHFLPTSIGELVARFTRHLFAANALILIAVNLGFLALGVFDWRAVVIALLLMLPNIVGDIGGAEKVGWATHYHDEYLPAVVWAGMAGLIGLNRLKIARKRPALTVLATAGVALFLWFIDPATGRFALLHTQQNFLQLFPAEVEAYLSPSGVASQRWARDLSAAIPLGVTVTAIEPAMPALYHGRTIEFYPLDVDHADYAVIGRLPDGSFTGAVSYLGPVERRMVNAVLVERLRKDGYDLAHPVFEAPNGVVALRRRRLAPK